MAITITREEIIEQYAEWGIDFIDEIEEKIRRELTDEECKKILLFCLGYVPNKYELTENCLNLDISSR